MSTIAPNTPLKHALSGKLTDAQFDLLPRVIGSSVDSTIDDLTVNDLIQYMTDGGIDDIIRFPVRGIGHSASNNILRVVFDVLYKSSTYSK